MCAEADGLSWRQLFVCRWLRVFVGGWQEGDFSVAVTGASHLAFAR